MESYNSKVVEADQTFKFVGWNMAHQTQERKIKARFIEAISKLDPDVLTLNEYVHGDTRLKMLEELAQLGFKYIEISTAIGKNNQILIASKFPLTKGHLFGPTTTEGGGESNFLHVIVKDIGIEIVGVRAPAYSSSTELHHYWSSLCKIIYSSESYPIIYIGDLNADPDGHRHVGSIYLNQLREDGWHIPSPQGAWSYVAGTRIDHAIASRSLSITDAKYISKIDDLELASKNTKIRISDHSPLVINVKKSS